MTVAARALAKGGWYERRNTGWRYSKAGLWLGLLQLGVAALLLWRLEPMPGRVPLMLPVTVVAFLGLLGAFVLGLLVGREELYGRSVLRALHVSPASGTSILVGLALAGLPGRLFSSLVCAGVIGRLLPAGSAWWPLPLLWGIGLLSSQLGHTAALLALVGWVRVAPHSLAVLWAVAVVLALNLAITLIGLVSVGPPIALVLAAVRPFAPWLVGGMGGLVLLPVLLVALWTGLRPERAGEWYREAYLAMQEVGEARRRTRRSRWPRLLPGPAGALQARLWREVWLNWFTWVRFAVMLLPLALLIWPSRSLLVLVDRFPALMTMSFGLLAALGGFGELLAIAGSSDGPNIGLTMVAGIKATQVVKAKWVSLLPFAGLALLWTWAASLLLGVPGLVPSLAAGSVALGFAVIAMTGGLFDLDPHAELVEREVPELLRAVLEQMPRRPGEVLGYALGFCFVAGAVGVGFRLPEAYLLVSVGGAALAHLALVAGYARLRRLGM